MARTAIKIGHDPDFAPLAYVAGVESRGIVVEIVRAVLAHAGYDARFMPLALPRFEAALAESAIDALAMQGIIPERLDRLDFSAPILTTGGAWFAPADRPWEPEHPPAAARVVTPVTGPLTNEIRRMFASLEVVGCATYPEALAAVIAGRADAAALNFQVGAMMAARDYPGRFAMPPRPFRPVPVGFAVAKGRHGAMLAAFDRALSEIRADGSFAEIERRSRQS